MNVFPGESAFIEELHAVLGDEFAFARRVLRYWVELPKQRPFDRSAVGYMPTEVSKLLDIQVYRQFRAVVEQCERGESECAQIIARSLFESALTTAFVLLPNVRIRQVSKVDSRSGNTNYRAQFPKKGKRRGFPIMPREFRAKLVVAHNALADYRYVESHKQKPGRKRVTQLLASEIPADWAKQIEAEIGPEWMSIVLETGSYSGLKIEQLAIALGHQLDSWYDTIYRLQSRRTHSSNLIAYWGEDGTLLWHCPPRQVLGALHTGIAGFLVHVSILQEQIGFGVGPNSAIPAFRSEYKQRCLKTFPFDKT